MRGNPKMPIYPNVIPFNHFIDYVYAYQPGVITWSVRHDRTSHNKENLLKPKVINGINCNQ